MTNIPHGELPIKSPEQELPPHSVVIVDVSNLNPEEREIWRQRGIKFLTDLDDDSYVKRFGEHKPTTIDGYNDAVNKFLENDKGPHFMVNIIDDNTGDLLASTSMYDLKQYAPHCVEISFTALIRGRGLGTEMLESAKLFLIENDYSHVYGFFKELGDSKHVFDKVFKDPIAGTHKDGYYWRTTENLTPDQRYTDAAISTYFGNLDTLNASQQEDGDDEERKRYNNKAINKIYKLFKKISIKASDPEKITFE